MWRIDIIKHIQTQRDEIHTSNNVCRLIMVHTGGILNLRMGNARQYGADEAISIDLEGF